MVATIAEVYELIGRLAARFSALEYYVRLLLEGLLGELPFVMPLFIDKLMFYNVIERCRDAAIFRFAGDQASQDKVKDLMKRVDEVRHRRNLFVHGEWSIRESELPNLKVMTLKLRRHDTLDRWEFAEPYHMTVGELRDELHRVDKLVREVMEFSEDEGIDRLVSEAWESTKSIQPPNGDTGQ